MSVLCSPAMEKARRRDDSLAESTTFARAASQRLQRGRRSLVCLLPVVLSETDGATMKIDVVTRSGKAMGSFDVPPSTTVEQFKELFSNKFHYYAERQWFNIGTPKGEVFKEGTLQENGLTDGSVLVFKDLGVQISWRLVFVLEYAGPLVIFPMLYLFPSFFYTQVDPQFSHCLAQRVAFWLTLIHYAKRELETLFVHRFSSATMPIERLPINCLHYWVLFGVCVGYFVLHPRYVPVFESPIVIYSLALCFLAFEAANFQTHIILRSLRPRGTKTRGMPHGWGFDLVSCANYFWETMAWLSFAILTENLTSWLFLVVAFGQMAIWALKKHRLYRQDFPDYPKIRKAIIPFLL